MKIRLKTIIGAAFLAGIYALPSHAQVGDQRHNLAIGVNGGINMNSVSFTPSVKQKNLMGINGGFTARYISEKYFNMICGAQIEVNFSQHGWDEYYEDYPDLSYTRTMNYVEIPFLAHLAFGKERGMQFFIHAGPQVGFMISDSEKIAGDWEAAIKSNSTITTEQHGKAIDKKFDYGITGGAGVELRTKAGNFIVEGRYYYALSDFYNSTKKDYFARSAHGAITAKITYLFDLKK
jgi:hypothetical protein